MKIVGSAASHYFFIVRTIRNFDSSPISRQQDLMYKLLASPLILLLILLLSCASEPEPVREDVLFSRIPAAQSGVDFANILTYDESFNPYTYRNFYNGGGVGIGDLNNDGLADLFFCGNQVDNKLYFNKGDFQFEDVTEQAGVACSGVWSSGVSLADVNGDGWLDIYICKAGPPEGERRYNELFINQGDGTFLERAREYGIADLGLSAHAAFFDYDRDGDLDCYLLNNSLRPVGGFDLREGLRSQRDPEGGNKLYRNDLQADGSLRFVDVSEEAGIYGSSIGFGLGVTIGDVNRDGWLDIYVSNDFFERDYLYLNNGDGTFRESLTESMGEISLSSMGADMADVNNDGLPEVFVTDMLPQDDARMKTKTKFDNWDKYARMEETGYHRQFTRNVFQLNQGLQPGSVVPLFAEIGRLSGVYATDWSWGALIADLDLDGRKDIFVANGIYKDLTDQDYINFYSDPNTIRQIIETKGAVIEEMIDAMPSEALPNYAFRNMGDLMFENHAAAWGLDDPGFSNGSAYGDLDNDGDLDLVLNNANMEAWVYRNNADKLFPGRHYLSLQFTGEAPNHFAMGTQVELFVGAEVLYQELTPMRGFQSTVDNRLHFGLGEYDLVDSIRIRWPDGSISILGPTAADQRLELNQGDLELHDGQQGPDSPVMFRSIPAPDYRHQENDFIDFDRDQLLVNMLSAEGPKITEGDVNGDGRTDFHIGGAKGTTGAIFIQQSDGSFVRTAQPLLEADAGSEDTDAAFFDVNQDGAPDLYVCSGGNEFSSSSRALFDRLYINDGNGNFAQKADLPFSRPASNACVAINDFDGDGDVDLFVGSRLVPFLYGVPVSGFLLQNDNGRLVDVTETLAPDLAEIGMITAAAWVNLFGDEQPELVLAGDWMSVRIFSWQDGKLLPARIAGLEQTSGFWNCVAFADLDQDGDQDLILGNQGYNSRIQAAPERPASMYINDFDGNGTAEQLIAVFNGPAAYPLVLRHDLVHQIPSLKKKYLKYENYKEQTIEDIFSPDELEGTVELEVVQTATGVAWNQGDGEFEFRPLPMEAQFSPVYAILVHDFNGDAIPDLFLGGNFFRAKPEIGINAASYGQVLLGIGEGAFEALSPVESGLFLRGEVRDFSILGGNRILVGINDQALQYWEFGIE